MKRWIYTQVSSKIGNLARRRPEFEQAMPAPKQLNLKSLAMQASANSVAVRRCQKPIFAFTCVCTSLLVLTGCFQAYNPDDELRTVPVTNNPNVVPNYGSGLPGAANQQGPY